MSIKKYVEVNVTIRFCFNADEALKKGNINIEAIQREIERTEGIDFCHSDGDTCIVNSVELINE